MTETQKIQLERKKAQVQLTQNLQGWLPYWLPVFNAVVQLKKTWSFEYFECAQPMQLPLWEAALTQLRATINIPLSAIKTPGEYYVHHKMKDLYPGSLSLRYMPKLSFHEACETDSAFMLAKAAETLAIPGDEEVYFFYNRFPPVLRLPFSSIGLLREEDVMTPEDLCIIPVDGSWLIFRSLENEWTWGNKIADIKNSM